ncbi:hypothetical protein DQ397_001449 [Pseudomonas sp. CK-NBRI-02]|nr:hypothetical protein DQ397_001449 [Pseudomonas sp. CK-NBRI-02]
MPYGRRFIGVNSVTNSDPNKGFLPVPIIRNEYWFEKFCFFRLVRLSVYCRQNLSKISNGYRKSLKYAGSLI